MTTASAMILDLLDIVLAIIQWTLIIQVILSWLIAFEVINRFSHRGVYQIYDMTSRLTDPLLRPIRRIVPTIGGVDISALILFIIVIFLRRWLPRLLLG